METTVELELVPVATSVPSMAVLYRAEHVPMVRRLTLMGSPADLAETIAHRAFRRVGREWDAIEDPLTAVRRVALEDLLARFRPAGRAPTRTPSRAGAPPEWDAVGPVLDPLTPIERVATVLRVYDGLDDEAVRELIPIRRRRGAEPDDPRLAWLFADAVADVSPLGRLSDLLGSRGPRGARGLDDDAGTDPRVARRLRRRGGRWMGVAVVSFAVVGALGGRFEADIGPTTGRAQELRTGLTGESGTAQTATVGAEHSSCPGTEPVIGPGGTPLPEEGDTDPRRVARLLATDRRAIVSLHRGALDARVLDRGGRVRRTGPNGVGRVRNIDAGDDVQIQVVIESAEQCPKSPQAWKGVPLVFTTQAAAASQAHVVADGEFADGTRWEVRDRPGLGLCARLGAVEAACGAELDVEEQLEPARLMADRAGRRLVFGYLPPGATVARVEREAGPLGPPVTYPQDRAFFVLALQREEAAVRIRFFDQAGAAIASVPFPSS